MKSFKRSLFISLLLYGYAYGMKPGQAVQATVKTYMIPEHQEAANHEFLTLLDSAKQQILVAMYWITDDFVVDRLIDVKKRGVDVQVIFDESSQNRDGLISQLLNNGIVPIVFPSTATESLMHNKFLVIDGSKVWTGSANFTKKAFDPTSLRFNHENVVIIDSSSVAESFSEGFYGAKNDAISTYIQLIADNDPRLFITKLSSILYTKDPEFRELLNEHFTSFNAAQKNRLRSFFPALQEKAFRPPTDAQRAFLQNRGLFKSGMSFDEASQLIGEIKEQEKKRPVPEQWTPAKRQKQEVPISAWQRNFLQNLGYDTRGMSYDEAYELIGQLR